MMQEDLFYALCKASSSLQIAFGDHPYASFESLSYGVEAQLKHVGS